MNTLNRSYDTEYLKLILEALTGVKTDGSLAAKATPNKRTVTGTGVLQNKKGVTLIAHGTDCTIFGDLCEDGRDYTFEGHGLYLEDILYNAGTGTFEILEVY